MPNENVASGQYGNVSSNNGGQVATLAAVHGSASRPKCHMRTNSADMKAKHPNAGRNGKASADFARQIRHDLSAALKMQCMGIFLRFFFIMRFYYF